jgi:hypothetical protein
MLHATQSTVLPPPQALSQQTPSTQNFDGHCAAVEHEPAGGDSDRMRARTRSTGYPSLLLGKAQVKMVPPVPSDAMTQAGSSVGSAKIVYRSRADSVGLTLPA